MKFFPRFISNAQKVHISILTSEIIVFVFLFCTGRPYLLSFKVAKYCYGLFE